MALDQIYVSGTQLIWKDSGNTYNITGVVPVAGSVSTPTQPSGRIWVSSAGVPYLYYSDETGTTRFISGYLRGATLNPNGRIYTITSSCPDYGANIHPAHNVYWTTGGNLYSARAENAPVPFSKILFTGLRWEISSIQDHPSYIDYDFTTYVDDPSETQGIKVGLNVSKYLSGNYFEVYSNSTCTGSPISTLGVNRGFFGNDTGVLPSSQKVGEPWHVTSSLYTALATDLGIDGTTVTKDNYCLSIKVNTGPSVHVLTSDSHGVDLADGDTFCASYDYVSLSANQAGQCINVSADGCGGGGPTHSCGAGCTSALDCAAFATNDCPACISNICTNSSGSIYCGNSCSNTTLFTITNASDCGGTCPDCIPNGFSGATCG